eukprot:6175260-Pleurochrysis_carterae.AAC.2
MHSADYPAFFDANEQPVRSISAESLTTVVQETLTTLLGPISEAWDEMLSLAPHNLGILPFLSNPCKWEIGVADELRPEEVGRMVQIPSYCPKARIVIVLAQCRYELPSSPHLVKRDNLWDGVYRADAFASPWYEGFSFMRWVDQFLMKPDSSAFDADLLLLRALRIACLVLPVVWVRVLSHLL